MLSVDLVICEPCDYDCDYCVVKEGSNVIAKEIIDSQKWFFDILKKLHKKHLISAIVIQGGDIGKVPEETLKYLFETLYPIKPIISCQKGFFDKNYHNIFKDNYSELFYHISDLKTIEKIENQDAITGIVDKDIEKIKKFLKINKGIDYIGFENDFSDISIDDLYHKIQEFNKLGNIIDTTKEELEQKRNNCTKSSYITVSLCTNKIVQCIRAYNNSVELNIENLKKFIKSGLFKKSKECESCSRSFVDKPIWSAEEKIKNLLEIR